MTRLVIAGIVTLGLVLWAHQLPTIGGRVPMVFVALWFGSAAMVALIFSTEGATPRLHRTSPQGLPPHQLWRYKLRMAVCCLLPFSLVPLLERRGVGNDPAVWLLDSALVISICSVPYFTLLARDGGGHAAPFPAGGGRRVLALPARAFVGGVALSVGAFQAIWICGASALFRIMERSVTAAGGQMAKGAAFEEFFRRPEYRYLFYILCAVMLLGYCPALLWLSHRRFLRHQAPPQPAPLATPGR
jgi:hypothetical protein